MAESIDELFECFSESYKDEDGKKIVEISMETENHESDETKGIKRKNEGCNYQEAKKIKDDIDIDINFEEFKNRIIVHSIETGGECTHEVAYPPGQEYSPLTVRDGEPSKVYQFTLDPFQKESILCVDNNQSVLVSAHTSAGKTVIAEYAVAKSLNAKQRVIYTTPIKALSNQKYREFLDEFRDVGLVTGDVTINPSASCLIMTTEILRNMLYRGSEIMREVGWVIFDEIHYMRDKERGVVWEETLILLPHNVHFVFLSATIPNARQFVEWVAHLHQQPCHVVYTDYRPTPLQHFIYPAGGNGIHMVVNEMGVFKDDSYNKAMAALQGDSAKGDTRGRRGGVANKVDPASTDIFKVIKMIMERDFAPAIVFSFSKKDCELYGTLMTKLDFNTAAEKKMVDEIFNNATDILSDEDKLLPQVQNILPLLRRGIGIHHGGLLPILKEVIEILFGEGLIKTLFATETFAMGLNMPARTVLFTGVRKFDGQSYRWISSGEYIQMSGRAGRRGIDDKGIVILMVDEKLPPAIGRDIVKGLPDPINSAFHLTYNMVLNLLRVEEINPEYMLERSFFQFQNQANIPILHNTYTEKLKEYNEYSIEEEEHVASYYSIKQELEKLGVTFREYITKPEYLIGFLQPGRLVKIKMEGADYDWGVIINFKKTPVFPSPRYKGKAKPKIKLQLDVLLHIVPDRTDIDNVIPKPCPPNETGEIEIVSVDSQYVTHISSVRLLCPADLTLKDSRKGLYKTVKEAKKRFSGELPLLDPVNDMKIHDKVFSDVLNKIKVLEKKLNEHVLYNTELLEREYEKYERKITCFKELEVAKKELLNAKSILQLDELKSRKRVLRRLKYCLDADVIQLKGRVACELSSADELLITEMIFNGTFGTLTPEQSCALLSCFVCDEKSSGDSPTIFDELSGPLKQMQDLARRIAKVSVEARLPLDEATYLEQFKPSLMDIVYNWCKGASFSDLCKMTDIFEGSIVRCMRRLEELLRQMVQASKTIGNAELEQKFNEAIKVIKRDIVFSSSLYL